MKLLTVKAFAHLAQISPHTLRYYDQVKLLRPHLVCPQTRYRYYHPHQIEQVRQIQLLRQALIPVEEIMQILETGSNSTLFLSRHEERLRACLEEYHRALELTHDLLSRSAS